MQGKYPNILYLTYDGLTDPLGQSQILPYLCRLSERGYKITIISAEKIENFAQRRELIEEIVRQSNINWYPVFYTKRPPVFSTLWDIQTIQKLAVRLCHQHKIHIIHCRSYITALIGLFIKRKLGTKFVFDMRGFWADERVEGGLWNLKNPIYRAVYTYFKNKEKQFLQAADYTVSLTYQGKEEIQNWRGLSSIPIQVIPCCVDTNLFNPQNGTRLSAISRPLSINNKGGGEKQPQVSNFTISYLGSVGTWYLLEEMLLFFKKLLISKPEAFFLFITPDDPQTILQKAESLGISGNKFIIRKAERKEVPLLLAGSHVSIFFIKPCYSKKASSPTKMGEILSMGIPVICNAGVGDTDYLFKEYNTGYLLNEFNQESYNKAVASIDTLLQIPAQQLRNVALTYFDLQRGVDLYDEVYQKLS